MKYAITPFQAHQDAVNYFGLGYTETQVKESLMRQNFTGLSGRRILKSFRKLMKRN